jgi:5-methylcytosine-specific restriction endonuclease McrA
MTRTLVLNKFFLPIDVIDSRRAFVLAWQDKARVVEAYQDDPIQTTSKQYPRPSVIHVGATGQLRFVVPKPSRVAIFRRDGWKCKYCGEEYKDSRDLTVDHVFPRSLGGKWRWDNLVAACKPCNQEKDNNVLPDPPRGGVPIGVVTLLLRDNIPDAWKSYCFR